MICSSGAIVFDLFWKLLSNSGRFRHDASQAFRQLILSRLSLFRLC